MTSILLSGPTQEPVTLDDDKAFLRVEHDADDDVIAALIAGARIHIEAQTRRGLMTQTWRIVRDAWPPDGRIAVMPVPVGALVAARIFKRGRHGASNCGCPRHADRRGEGDLSFEILECVALRRAASGARLRAVRLRRE